MTDIQTSAPDKQDDRTGQATADMKAIREAQGLTLRDICETTKVSVIHLQAIENEDYHLFPPPVYSKSFIKKYCEVVGIESGPLLSRYEKYIMTDKMPLEQKNSYPQSLITRHAMYMMAGIALAVIVGAIFVLSPLSTKRDSALDTMPPAASVIAPEATPATAANSEQTGDPAGSSVADDATAVQGGVSEIIKSGKDAKPEAIPATQTKTDPTRDMPKQDGVQGPYVLNIEAKALTWIRITGDNEPYEVLLKPGEKIERRASQRFLILCGNAGGIDVVFQGKSLGVLGKPGEVVHLSLP